MKRKVKIAIDILMFLSFLHLMGYHPGAGLYSHGAVGIALFVLFIVHHLLNLGWYRALPKGRHPFERSAVIALDFIFLVDMVLMAVSSVMMSELVFAFSPVQSTQLGRDLHVGSTSWGFLIMALHVGLHFDGKLSKLGRKLNGKCAGVVYKLLGVALFILGIWSLFDSRLAGKLVLKTSWDAPPKLFHLELFAIVAAACVLVHWALSFNRWLKQRRNLQQTNQSIKR